MSAVEAR